MFIFVKRWPGGALLREERQGAARTLQAHLRARYAATRGKTV